MSAAILKIQHTIQMEIRHIFTNIAGMMSGIKMISFKNQLKTVHKTKQTHQFFMNECATIV